ncbi:MAG: D-alanyl-D-alanine carboxypeptidase/D-alanyl-D-alanine-endopeptidase [Frankiaceae bacterium]|nr:D-alanyl-D-alanine carboxypeptidase/D-alanyl-D-alanine-endopeptidase [Frankiaceae bacterium]
MRGGWTGRRTAVVGAAAALVLAASSTAAFVLRDDVARVLPLASPSPEVTRAPLLAATGEQAGAPTAAGVAAALAAGLKDKALGGHVAISVLDALTGEPVLETAAREVVLPASTAKIATAVAALTALPSDLRLTTRVVAGAAPGDVVLVGGGDTTLAGPYSRPGYPRAARLADLAALVRAAIAGAPVRRVIVDDSLYGGPLLGPGWRPAYVTSGDVAPVMALMVDSGRTKLPPLIGPARAPRTVDPALAAGRSLARLLGAPGAVVSRGSAPADATPLGEVHSPPVPQLVEAMLTRSDNDLAESLARQIAIAKGQPATFAGVAVALRAVLGEVLTRAGATPGSVLLSDGSGLSRLDRVQPGALTRLLASVAGTDRERLFPVLSGLPVAGFDGTLERRYRRGPGLPAAGVVRAKTGGLNGVTALAGLVRTRDGRLLAFDFTADSVPLSAALTSQTALDRLAAALAACGCR